jgi:hypothetical protein
MVLLTPEQKKGHKLYKGYFIYRILSDKLGKKKAYNFLGYPKEMVEKLRAQFTNPHQYQFYGEKVVRIKEEEKSVE